MLKNILILVMLVGLAGCLHTEEDREKYDPGAWSLLDGIIPSPW
jgi:hypothetical protein